MLVCSLSQEDPLEKDMATHSSILAWRTLWTEEPGRLLSLGLQRVGHDYEAYLAHMHTFLSRKGIVNNRNMEAGDAGPAEPSSRPEASVSADDRLFLVKGVVWRGAGVRSGSPGALACAGAGVPTHTLPGETLV